MNDPLKTSKKLKPNPDLLYQDVSLEAGDVQQRIDAAFSLLFEEVLKRRIKIQEKAIHL